ncbi:MAG TPA: DNA polymerase II large subunit [Candidatus Nanoarchaeia archaeon]|nr:DNA polymerase II large subunit [Candidatus Nanoarchaeia archaeon]
MGINWYFEKIQEAVQKSHAFANAARKSGVDPADEVEILLASNMAERVVGLISSVAPQIKGSGVIERILELEKEYGVQDSRVALKAALEVAQQKFCAFKDQREAMEVGMRVGLAYLTNGVVGSPLEGFVQLKLRKRRDGKGEYFALYFSGPIRSAGTTAASLFVVLCDYIRIHMGYAAYDPSEEEVKRMVTELYDYHEKVTNLQYLPSEEEITFMVEHLPVQIDGDASEKYDVSNYKGLERIEANKIRNGPCLTLGEGLCQKASKVYVKKINSWIDEFGLGNWHFLKDFVMLQKNIRAKTKEIKQESTARIKPDYAFIKDVVAGRPVFTHPLRQGGFRLRYGRARNSGFSAQAVHPATMVIVDSFIAVGTQLKVERPGKSSVIASCDTVEGPIVKLKDGSVIFVEDEHTARKICDDVAEIIYLGDLLINYGDFLNRGHMLVPAGYNEDQWMQETGMPQRRISIEEAIQIARSGKPLHPRYTYHWNAISKEQLQSLLHWLSKSTITETKIILPLDQAALLGSKRALELLGVPHRVVAHEHIVIEGEWAQALLFSLGGEFTLVDGAADVLDIINKKSGSIVRDKDGTYIGARMGRPEKAKMRKLKGSPQVLFPVGSEGGRMRSFQSALEKGNVTSQFALFKCSQCRHDTLYRSCEKCGQKTEQLYACTLGLVKPGKCHPEDLPYSYRKIDLHHYFDAALKQLDLQAYPELIKGVRGTMNESHIPEHLTKGIARAMHQLYVNKDGTIRYDMTEMPLTHFKPKEIGSSIEKLKELGYTTDVHGRPLENADQILELLPQDVVLPAAPDSPDEGADTVLFHVGKFIDMLLEKVYKKEPFYNFKSKQDVVGSLVVGLSPHTSAGVVGRVIGFSKAQVLYAHPYFHSIMRRDADGDEACVIMLMDAFLNFSNMYLSNHRGAKQDEPLVLTSVLVPKDVDDMVFDMDIADHYPIELYQAAKEYKQPWEVKIECVKNYLGTERESYGFMFTHDTDDINNGVRCSSYKFIPTMQEKVEKQMDVAEKIRAVDHVDVARLVIERHFIRDIRGNLRKFSSQQFRCVNCNEKYRRPPLAGKCLQCDGKIIFTIAEGSIVKYLEPSLALAKKYALSPYLRQSLEITKARIESIFGKPSEKQEGLGKWF